MIKNLFRRSIDLGAIPGLKTNDRVRLSNMRRFERTFVKFMGRELMVPDAGTFLSSCNEIFTQEIYKFNTDEKSPVIIDCGANIGLATLYYKLTYPGAKILAFEPDPQIFAALKHNIEAFDFKDIELYNQAIGDKKAELLFNMEGGHSGMLVPEPTGKTVVVSATPLREILTYFERVDFLKIDIEGYEINVLPTVSEALKKVNNMFLEYHTFIDQQQQLSTIINLIEKAGFRYYIKEAAYKKNPFLERELFYKMDMLVNIFCYR